MAKQPSPLLRLPESLRRPIYEYSLVSSDPIEIHPQARRNSVVSQSPLGERGPSRFSSLLQVCRQIRQEASSIYYEKNTFIVPWGFPNLGCRWLDEMTTSTRLSLRDVRFCYGDGAFWTVYDAKTALSSLQTGLKKSGALADLQELKLWVPVCEWSVHSWRELKERDDACWVSLDETRPFAHDKIKSQGLWRIDSCRE
ncbi:hypothetical protein Slin15195_G028140 [Septoria linicola]|uniref:Uncharacterized protein n=1 Tax=Septoria linicola TaxID=215465 RepID=A0A9Q9AN61_9PEZI|nr:hypothetical protein Slin14017_G027190 [Septoria linicola]USW49495.1 hypothetical protein Slin15195_G028140 [Septoria linicola]